MESKERYYKISHLHIWFAVSAILLLLALLWTFADDYRRDWKEYQQQFRKLQIEKTRSSILNEEDILKEDDEYQDILDELAEARKTLAQNEKQLDESHQALSRLKTRKYIDDQAAQFVKSEYNAAKYLFEEALGHGKGDVKSAKANLDQLAEKMRKLRLVAEATESKYKQQEANIKQINEEVEQIEAQENAISRKRIVLKKRLPKIDRAEMSFGNQIADMFRDLPLVDFMAPYYKINQIVVDDVVDDVIFAKVPKVDRCTTCHLSILDSNYKDNEQPLKPHPRLDLFLSSQSPHPVEKFGCTSCHKGRGRGTSFYTSVHEPSTAKQKEEWAKRYDWQRMNHWEKPMYPVKFSQAGCFQCHENETFIKGADKLNLGLNLIERAGCFGCHIIKKYKDKRRIGPDLNRIAAKVSKDWTVRWINNPKAFRFNTWMPSFFGQANNNDPESVKRTDQEINAIVHYLFKNSSGFEMVDIPVKGDAKRGEKYVSSFGCLGCHRMAAKKGDYKTSLQSLRRDHGPNLIGLGSKTSEKWIYNWIKNPGRYFSRTKMPNLRLSNQEAADITSFLVKSKRQEFMQAPASAQNEKVLDVIVLDLLMKMISEVEAKDKLAKMQNEEKLDYAGEKLIRNYGCFGCHNIPGFEKEKPIGTELTIEGSKPVERLDFGYIDIEHTNYAWFTQKLKNPRIFDRDKLRTFGGKLRMPNFSFTDDEIEAIVTVLLGFVEKDALPSIHKPRTVKNRFVEQGQWIIREYNCQGCHIIEEEGGAIRPMIHKWLMEFKQKSEIEADDWMLTFSPPVLHGEGEKVQTAWLFDFIHSPEVIRPWMTVRMPTYSFDTEQVNTLVRYFSYTTDLDFPFQGKADLTMSPEERNAGKLLFSEKFFNCGSCHIRGNKLPQGSPVNWAPNFALAKKRLKLKWMLDWIKDPQAFLPGTKMPNFYDPDPEYFMDSGPENILEGNAEKQILAVRNYILTTF